MKSGGWQLWRENRENERASNTKGGVAQKGEYGCSLELKGVIGLFGEELPLVGNTRPTLQVSCEPNPKPGPLKGVWVRIIGVICGNLLRSCGSAEIHTGEMFKRHFGSYAKSGFGRSSRGSTWQERRQKRHEDKEYG